MQARFVVTRLAVVIGLALSLVSCEFFDRVQGMKTFKEANVSYQRQDFQRAAEAYEEVVAFDPNLTVAYFYLGNSYDNLYTPNRRGEPENDAYLDKAIANYKLAIERVEDPALRKLAMQYLAVAYGPDKLNDPNASEPLLQSMIDLDRTDPDNYFALAKLYENAGRYDLAEQTLLRGRDVRPDDPGVYLQMAGFYNRNGEFEKAVEALQERAAREPTNPEAFYTISTYYWEKAFRDFSLNDDEKRQHVITGLEMIDKAISLNADYAEALTYKNILLRMQANLEEDLGRQRALIAEADQLRNRAEELMAAKTAGLR